MADDATTRALLAAQAESGQAGVRAFRAAQAQMQESQKAAVAEALRTSALRGATGGVQQMTAQQVGNPYARHLASLQGAQATFEADVARRQGADASYADAVHRARGLIGEEVSAKRRLIETEGQTRRDTAAAEGDARVRAIQAEAEAQANVLRTQHEIERMRAAAKAAGGGALTDKELAARLTRAAAERQRGEVDRARSVARGARTTAGAAQRGSDMALSLVRALGGNLAPRNRVADTASRALGVASALPGPLGALAGGAQQMVGMAGDAMSRQAQERRQVVPQRARHWSAIADEADRMAQAEAERPLWEVARQLGYEVGVEPWRVDSVIDPSFVSLADPFGTPPPTERQLAADARQQEADAEAARRAEAKAADEAFRAGVEQRTGVSFDVIKRSSRLPDEVLAAVVESADFDDAQQAIRAYDGPQQEGALVVARDTPSAELRRLIMAMYGLTDKQVLTGDLGY